MSDGSSRARSIGCRAARTAKQRRVFVQPCFASLFDSSPSCDPLVRRLNHRRRRSALRQECPPDRRGPCPEFQRVDLPLIASNYEGRRNSIQ